MSEEHPTHPKGLYGATKLMAEDLIRQAAAARGCEAVILRFAQIYGPGSPSKLAMYHFIEGALQGVAPRITVDPAMRRDYLHLDDAVAALARAVGAPLDKRAHVVNVGAGAPFSVGELAALVCETLASPAPVSELADTQGGSLWLDCSRARAVLGWTPLVTPLEGIRQECRRLAQLSKSGEKSP